MNDLIKIRPQNIGGQTIETVNARDLHRFLEGFSFIGIEREAEYLEIAKARIAHVSP